MKKLFSLISLFFILISVAVAQESTASPEDIAAKYNISFPIAELGGCEDYGSCRTHCEDPINKTTCVAFARARGFYQEDKLSDRQEEILAIAKSELGCSDKSSCEAVCHLKENFDKCSAFAQKHGIRGGHANNPSKQEIITKAKEVLGCDSEATCRAICEQELNRDKCSTFAQQVGLRGGEIRRGPGGCTSEQTCQTYCTDPTHFNECSQYGERRGPGGFSGPGGCNSEESCRAYCEKNQNACHSSDQQEQKGGDIEQCFGSGRFWYNETCNDKPMSGYFDKVNNPRIEECFRSGKFWDGKECRERSAVEKQYEQRKAQEYGDYCRQNPDKCKPGQTADFTNVDERTGFENFCTKYPDQCRIVQIDQSGQKSECESEAGKQYSCRWTGTRCDCPGYSPSSGGGAGGPGENRCGGGTYWNGSACVYPNGAPTGFSGCPAGTYWNGSSCLSSQNSASNCPSGQYWNGSSCVTTTDQQQQQKTPEQMCAEAPNCKWENNTCNCSASGGSGSTTQSPEQQCAASARCWRDGSCQDCSSAGSYPTPAGSGGGDCEATGGHWENGGCVHGETIQANLLERIVGFFSKLFWDSLLKDY